MVDVNTGRTIASNYPPTVEQRPEITDSNENLISEVDYNISTVGEAQRPCLVANCRYLTWGMGELFCLSHLAQVWHSRIEEPSPSELIMECDLCSYSTRAGGPEGGD